MDILSSSSAFLPCFNKQSPFSSSQSAFKKPQLPTTIHRSKQTDTKPLSVVNSNIIPNKVCKPIRIMPTTEDVDLLIPTPVKKVKLTQPTPTTLSTLNIFKPKEIPVRSSQLTIDAVFNTPDETKATQNGIGKEDVFDDGSSLSFISSCDSLDDLDGIEEELEKPEAGKEESEEEDCLIIEPTIKTNNHAMDEKPYEPLFVKVDYGNCLGNLNQTDVFSNSLTTSPMAFPMNQYTSIHPLELLKNLQMVNQPTFTGIDQLAMFNQSFYGGASNNLNQAFQPDANGYNLFYMEGNQSDAQVEDRKVKISEEDGYDSDSLATRSTGLELSLPSEKSQKSLSPTYSMNIDMHEGVKFTLRREKKEKKEKQRKPKKERTTNQKEKKNRSLNLTMEINPKHLKVERRLNRLQLLRYQQNGIQEKTDLINDLTHVETVTPVNNTAVEAIENQLAHSEIQDNIRNPPISEKYQAVVPPFDLEVRRRRREVFTPVWTPEILEESQVEVYLQQLSKVVELQVTDQQKALRLLESFNGDISSVLMTVQADKASYKELFRVKARRHRRK